MDNLYQCCNDATRLQATRSLRKAAHKNICHQVLKIAFIVLLLINISSANKFIVLKWNASPTPKVKYNVWKSRNGAAFVRQAIVNGTSYTFNAPNGSYKFYVTAYYKTDSAKTNTVSVTVP